MDEKSIVALVRKLQTEKVEWKSVDAKQELRLIENGDKAEFIKDITAMANNGEPSYIIVGLQDKTFQEIGCIKYRYDKNTLNQILANKIDPPIVVDYREFKIHNSEVAVIEVNGTNPPYIVAQDIIHARKDRKQARIYKGTIYVRHEDRTVGISRIELDEILHIRKSIIEVSLEQKTTDLEDKYIYPLLMYVHNQSDFISEDIEVLMWFDGCELLECPEDDHGHIEDHYGERFRDESLTYSIARLGGKSVSKLKRFGLVKKMDAAGISFIIRGSNVEKREFSISLDEIDDKFRLW
jgi:hypothetical protein